MLEALSDRLGAIFQRLTSRGRLTEADVNDVAREVRVALLEADVNLSVAKDFVAKVKEKAVGADVLASLTPAQSVIKIVHDELVQLLGGAEARLTFADAPPTSDVGFVHLDDAHKLRGQRVLRGSVAQPMHHEPR